MSSSFICLYNPTFLLYHTDVSPYTYADGTWDWDGFLRHLHQQNWIPNKSDDHSVNMGMNVTNKFSQAVKMKCHPQTFVDYALYQLRG